LCIALPGIARYLHRLRDAIKSANPDVVHTNGFKMHWLGACAAPTRLPVIWHLHDFLLTRPLMRWLLLTQVRGCAEAIAVSSSVAEDARRALGPALPLATISNLGRFTPQGPRLDLDRLAGLAPAAEDTVRIGIVATMARWKGQEVFLRALALLPPGLRVRSYMIGGPVYETGGSQYGIAELEEIARRHGLADRVGFTGFVTDIPAALRALDIVVHASTAPEPFGLVIAEAMACGRMVIASAGGGAAEIAADGDGVLTHPPGDHAMLARLMSRLAEDRELRRHLGCAAAASAKRRFGRERLAYELQPVYERVMRNVSQPSADALSHQSADELTRESGN
jgi:glycosyltransferase involved in cell wall biosynthesis